MISSNLRAFSSSATWLLGSVAKGWIVSGALKPGCTRVSAMKVRVARTDQQCSANAT
jgi:hypothetical protein